MAVVGEHGVTGDKLVELFGMHARLLSQVLPSRPATRRDNESYSSDIARVSHPSLSLRASVGPRTRDQCSSAFSSSWMRLFPPRSPRHPRLPASEK